VVVRSWRARDSQKKRLYAAEEQVPGIRDTSRLCDVTELQGFVDRIVSSAWFQARWPIPAIRVKDGRGRTRAGGSASDHSITMPRWARSPLITLHEIAHVVIPPGPTVAAHGREYAAAYLALARRFGDPGQGDQLEAAFILQRVRYRPKRRSTSPGNAAALVRWRACQQAQP
jgi:putative metallohydrolase (TIGR04338 family)